MVVGCQLMEVYLDSLIRLKFILSLSKGSRFFLFCCLSEVEGNGKEKSSNQVGLREIRD